MNVKAKVSQTEVQEWVIDDPTLQIVCSILVCLHAHKYSPELSLQVPWSNHNSFRNETIMPQFWSRDDDWIMLPHALRLWDFVPTNLTDLRENHFDASLWNQCGPRVEPTSSWEWWESGWDVRRRCDLRVLLRLSCRGRERSEEDSVEFFRSRIDGWKFRWEDVHESLILVFGMLFLLECHKTNVFEVVWSHSVLRIPLFWLQSHMPEYFPSNTSRGAAMFRLYFASLNLHLRENCLLHEKVLRIENWKNIENLQNSPAIISKAIWMWSTCERSMSWNRSSHRNQTNQKCVLCARCSASDEDSSNIKAISS